jgi:hypothetical protein
MESNFYRSWNLSVKNLMRPHQQLGETKSWCTLDSTCAQQVMHVLLATNHLQHWRNEGNAIRDHILTADESWMHSFDHQLKQ